LLLTVAPRRMTGASGELILLNQQDRSLSDRRLIAESDRALVCNRGVEGFESVPLHTV